MGVEPTTATLATWRGTAPDPGNSRVAAARAGSVACQLPAELTRVVEAWERLRTHIKAAVLALVGAAGGSA